MKNQQWPKFESFQFGQSFLVIHQLEKIPNALILNVSHFNYLSQIKSM